MAAVFVRLGLEVIAISLEQDLVLIELCRSERDLYAVDSRINLVGEIQLGHAVIGAIAVDAIAGGCLGIINLITQLSTASR